ncbi:hypothetical protein DSO57_1034634 [Entomophthora muscae]|uniref:Uncharacterized protein n=1 Tax=Entomophthora muscae TaxID=34485 RepID=A0ACC2UKG1_9FUNG|nr:hypothetical protein DSO57_1034634 [Entomophthora muscae]
MRISDAFFKPFCTLTLGERIVIEGSVELLDHFSFILALVPFYVLPYLCLVKSGWNVVDVLLVAWCVSELLFRVYVDLRVMVGSRYRAVPAKQGKELVEMAREMFSQMDDAMQFKHWFSKSHCLSKESLGFLMKRVFFEKYETELTKSEVLHSKEILDLILPRCHLKHAPFSKQESLWQSVNPVQYKVRSVVVYGVMGAIRTMGAINLYNLGFQWNSLPTGLGYWIRQRESSQPPILYFHGIGFGPTQMLPHIRSLHKTHPHRTFIIFYLPQIAYSPYSPVATEDDVIRAIDIVFRDNDLKKVSVVGHSFGTLVSMWLAKARPEYLAQLTLIDPVCFMAWNASLFNRACHSTPSTMLHHTIRRIISRDHNFALTISRYMYWPTSFHICNTFPCPTNIYLAKNDWVIDAPATYAYLMQRKCSLSQTNLNIHLNDIDHLQFMFTPKLLRQINCSS